MTAVILLGALAFSIVCVWAMVALLHRWHVVGLALIAIFALIAWELPDSPSLVSVAGLQVKPEDFICVALLASAATSARVLGRNVRRCWPLLVFFVVCVGLSLGAGLVQSGAQAFNEARSTIWLMIALAWILSRDWTGSFHLVRYVFLASGLLLSVLAVAHTLIYGWGGADSFVTTTTGILQTGRPLVSGQALILLCCGLFLVLAAGVPRVRDLLIGYFFIIVSVLCMHRSVWVAVLTGVVIMAISLRGKALAVTVFIAFYLGVAILCVLAYGGFSDLGDTIEHALSSDGTLNAREGSWTELIDQSIQSGPGTVLFGASFGAGWGRVVKGVFVDFNPHNWYVVLYLRLGLIGLAAALAILSYAVMRLISRSRAFLSIMLAICAYAWFYHLAWFVAPWLGLALYLAFRADREGGAVAPGDREAIVNPNRETEHSG